MIFIDADACPVKEEVYRVAKRYRLRVTLVANSWMRVPRADWLEMVIVDGELDAADAWIVEHVAENDVVITADIPLASLCLQKGARVLGHRGRPFTTDSIGEALATRDLMSHLRDLGTMTGGPPPFGKRDRSQFLQGLDEAVQAARRADLRPPGGR